MFLRAHLFCQVSTVVAHLFCQVPHTRHAPSAGAVVKTAVSKGSEFPEGAKQGYSCFMCVAGDVIPGFEPFGVWQCGECAVGLAKLALAEDPKGPAASTEKTVEEGVDGVLQGHDCAVCVMELEEGSNECLPCARTVARVVMESPPPKKVGTMSDALEETVPAVLLRTAGAAVRDLFSDLFSVEKPSRDPVCAMPAEAWCRNQSWIAGAAQMAQCLETHAVRCDAVAVCEKPADAYCKHQAGAAHAACKFSHATRCNKSTD